MSMTPREVFDHHSIAFGAGDIDEIVADYTEKSIVVRPGKVARGLAEIRAGFEEICANFEGMEGKAESVTVEGPVVLLEWTARSSSGRVAHGNDSFIIEDGKILYQSYVGPL